VTPFSSDPFFLPIVENFQLLPDSQHGGGGGTPAGAETQNGDSGNTSGNTDIDPENDPF